MERTTRGERITIRLTKPEKKELKDGAKKEGFLKGHNGRKIPDLAAYARHRMGL